MMKKKMLLIGCAAAIAVVAGGTLLWMNWEPDAEYRFRVRFHSTRERSSTVGGIKWHYAVIDGEANIVKAVRRGPKPFSDSVVLPTNLDGYPVAGVWGSIFKNDDPVRSLVIPEGVKEIGWCAFNGVRLESVAIPSTVTNIDKNALSCRNVRKFIVSPDNQNFREINGLVCTKDGKELIRCVGGDVIIPNGVDRIPDYAFSGSDLRSVMIPEGVISIGDGAFNDCMELKSISIPPGVKNIGPFAFEGCLKLENVELPPGVTNIEDYAFEGCKQLKKIVIPDGVVEICRYAFANCESLESVTLPSTLQRIDGYAFSVCSRNLKMTMNLKDVIISPGAFSQANDLSEYRGVNRLGIQRENDGYWFFDGRRLDMRWRSQDNDQ
ncbi:MAG: leucine-rich repeat domain-containing protein [Victivallales bacterium]|nr:leucine-rich repeat domain-containing protein [Victivallales bacterium]